MPDKKLVLVVDDDAAIREMIQTVLAAQGEVRILASESAIEALHLVAEERPSLIVLDIMMPGINGLQVAGILREHQLTNGIPIIAISGRSSRQQAVAAGCADYLQKPFAIADFVSTIQKHLPK